MDPTTGRIVHYRLTRQNAIDANRRYVHARDHVGDHRDNANGVQVHIGNQHASGDVVPLLVVRTWDHEFDVNNRVCPDYLPDDDPNITWTSPASHWGVNGQAFFDGNDSLWITSAPQGDFNGAWNWPPLAPPVLLAHA